MNSCQIGFCFDIVVCNLVCTFLAIIVILSVFYRVYLFLGFYHVCRKAYRCLCLMRYISLCYYQITAAIIGKKFIAKNVNHNVC